jgi:hypothetical protein
MLDSSLNQGNQQMLVVDTANSNNNSAVVPCSGFPSLEHEKDIPPSFTQAAYYPPGKTLDKLDLPGAAKAGPGPPSPRGPGPGLNNPTPQQQQQNQFQEKPFANHVGERHPAPNNNVINPNNNSKQLSVPNQTLTNNNHHAASTQPPRAAPPTAAAVAPVTKPVPPPQSRPPPKSFSPSPPSPPTAASEPPPNARPTKSDMSPRVSKLGGVAPVLAAPPPRMDPQVPSFPDPAVLRQPNTLQINEPPQMNRGRTPTRQERNNNSSRLAATISDFSGNTTDLGGGGNGPLPSTQPGGGYNFQKIMDDRFEHYKRPPSRERSADRFGGLGSRQGSRQQLAGAAATRDVSRDRAGPPTNRPQSRQRTPLQGLGGGVSESKPLDSLNLDGGPAVVTGNGTAVGGLMSGADLRIPAEDQLRFRGVQQEIPHFGAPPKRTESLYMKPGLDPQQPQYKVS